ncbi:rRNA-processing protein UTP23 homolog [Brevipalpus obovatus]|uniref:rRNA-processing protein UTP23 homolog n=1 Tax=Brevipalpus obovatus TaxID=246614 RepID=UPI003D9DE609
MKIRRYKKVSKYLSFYRAHFGFHSPYLVVIDGFFCQKALENKVNLNEQIPKYLGDQVKMFTTLCVINETQELGKSAYGAHCIVKQFSIRKCDHSKNPVPASQCILSMIGENNNDHLIVATNDLTLTEKLRELPGCPILYMKLSAMNLEKPSEASLKMDGEIKRKLLGSESVQLEHLNSIKERVLGSQESANRSKRKRKGGPNPLSCKKKKPKTEPSNDVEKETEDNPSKRPRRRRKLKVAKHIRKLLESHDIDPDSRY